jgi:hypothetical protein
LVFGRNPSFAGFGVFDWFDTIYKLPSATKGIANSIINYILVIPKKCRETYGFPCDPFPYN